MTQIVEAVFDLALSFFPSDRSDESNMELSEKEAQLNDKIEDAQLNDKIEWLNQKLTKQFEYDISILLLEKKEKAKNLQQKIMLACFVYIFWALITIPALNRIEDMGSYLIIIILVISFLSFSIWVIRELFLLRKIKRKINVIARMIKRINKRSTGYRHEQEIINKIKYHYK